MATITEDYVSFETAKLLKEKGFEGHSILTIYDKNAANAYIKELKEKHLPYSSDDPKLKEFYYTQPTHQMAMKWLREVHNIFISIIYEKYDEVFIADVKSPVSGIDCWVDNKHNCWFKYEEAAEEAIKFCLKNLI
jgi:hypothetical protein